MDRRVGGTSETHIDDPGALGGRPVEAFEDVEGNALGLCTVLAERTHRQQMRGRSRANEPGVCRDQTSDRSPVAVRLSPRCSVPAVDPSTTPSA